MRHKLIGLFLLNIVLLWIVVFILPIHSTSISNSMLWMGAISKYLSQGYSWNIFEGSGLLAFKKLPLAIQIEAFLFRMVPVNEISHRVILALFSLGTAAPVFFLGTLAGQSMWSGFLAVAILFSTGEFVTFGEEHLLHQCFTFFSMFSIFFFIKSFECDRGRSSFIGYVVGWVISFALMILAGGSAAFFVLFASLASIPVLARFRSRQVGFFDQNKALLLAFIALMGTGVSYFFPRYLDLDPVRIPFQDQSPFPALNVLEAYWPWLVLYVLGWVTFGAQIRHRSNLLVPAYVFSVLASFGVLVFLNFEFTAPYADLSLFYPLAALFIARLVAFLLDIYSDEKKLKALQIIFAALVFAIPIIHFVPVFQTVTQESEAALLVESLEKSCELTKAGQIQLGTDLWSNQSFMSELLWRLPIPAISEKDSGAVLAIYPTSFNEPTWKKIHVFDPSQLGVFQKGPESLCHF